MRFKPSHRYLSAFSYATPIGTYVALVHDQAVFERDLKLTSRGSTFVYLHMELANLFTNNFIFFCLSSCFTMSTIFWTLYDATFFLGLFLCFWVFGGQSSFVIFEGTSNVSSFTEMLNKHIAVIAQENTFLLHRKSFNLWVQIEGAFGWPATLFKLCAVY